MTAALVAGVAGGVAGLALADAWGALAPAAAAAAAPRAASPRLPARWGGHATGMPVLVVVAAALGWTMLGMVGALAAPLVAAVAAHQLAGARERRAGRERERGVGPLARSMADGLRGGHSIRGALHGATTDRAVAPALRSALATLGAGLARGASLSDSLAALATLGGPQLTLLSAVVALHAERGGALVRELESLAEEAERAVRLDEERASATAQARATVRTVAALPLLALAAAQLLGGDFLAAVARKPAALALLVAGLVLEAVAVLVTRRLVARAA